MKEKGRRGGDSDVRSFGFCRGKQDGNNGDISLILREQEDEETHVSMISALISGIAWGMSSCIYYRRPRRAWAWAWA